MINNHTEVIHNKNIGYISSTQSVCSWRTEVAMARVDEVGGLYELNSSLSGFDLKRKARVVPQSLRGAVTSLDGLVSRI